MNDPRLTKMAEILLQYSTSLQPGDWVLINANMAARPLVEEICRQVWVAGGRISLHWESDELNEIFLDNASDEVLDWLSPAEQLLFERVNVILYLDASDNTRILSGINPERMKHYQRGRGFLRQIRNLRVQSENLRWVYTQYPCHALAQEAGMGLRAYQDFAFAAMYADQPDPVANWRAMQQRQQGWVDWLKGRHQVALRGENIDLKLSISNRTFIECLRAGQSARRGDIHWPG